MSKCELCCHVQQINCSPKECSCRFFCVYCSCAEPNASERQPLLGESLESAYGAITSQPNPHYNDNSNSRDLDTSTQVLENTGTFGTSDYVGDGTGKNVGNVNEGTIPLKESTTYNSIGLNNDSMDGSREITICRPTEVLDQRADKRTAGDLVDYENDQICNVAENVVREIENSQKPASEASNENLTKDAAFNCEKTTKLSRIFKESGVMDNLELTYGLMDWLISQGVIDLQLLEDIKQRDMNNSERNEIVLSCIGDSNLQIFLEGLQSTNQMHIRSFIDHKVINKENTEDENDNTDDWPLSDSERRTINKLYAILVEEMRPIEVSSELLSAGCINYQHLMSIQKHRTMYEKNRKLLDIVNRRSRRDVVKFWEFVIKSSGHLKYYLDKLSEANGNLEFIKIRTRQKLTEEQLNQIKEQVINQNHKEFKGNETELKMPNICVSGEDIYMMFDQTDGGDIPDVESEETKSEVMKALVACIGDSDVMVDNLENVDYTENKTEYEEEYRQAISLIGVKQDHKHLQENTRTDIVDGMDAVRGITIVGDSIFVLQPEQSGINVYDANTLKVKPPINISDVGSLEDLAGCSHSNTLYITDQELHCIHKINILDYTLELWDAGEKYRLWGVSVTLEHDILVVAWIRKNSDENLILKYSSKGQLINEIKLDESICGVYQALQMNKDYFIVVQGGFGCSLHRICAVNPEGQLIKCYGKESGKGNKGLNGPRSITVNYRRKLIFVADYLNDRIVILDYKFSYQGQVETLQDLSRPARLYYDMSSARLIVGEMFNGRLLIISKDESI